MNTEHNDQHNLQPESSGIKPKPVIWFLVILTVSTILVFLIVEGMLYGLKKMDEANQAQPVTALPEGRERKLPPEPRLQGAPDGPGDQRSLLPLAEMEQYRKEIDQKTSSFGWVNKDAGIAHISLDSAKKMMVERGLPMGSDKLVEDVQKAETARRRILGAESSAGRTIGGQ
jgi:hypothetical protein